MRLKKSVPAIIVKVVLQDQFRRQIKNDDSFDAAYDYRLEKAHCPADIDRRTLIGRRVIVPFGKKELSGFVVEVVDSSTVEKIKAIKELIDEPPLLNIELLDFLKVAAAHYCSHLDEVIASAVPAFSRLKEKRFIHLSSFGKTAPLLDPQEQKLTSYLQQRHGVSRQTLIKQLQIAPGVIDALCERGVIEERRQRHLGIGSKPKVVSGYVLASDGQKPNLEKLSIAAREKIQKIVDLFNNDPWLKKATILKHYPSFAYALDKAVELCIVRKERREEFREAHQDDVATAAATKVPQLNSVQHEIVTQLTALLNQHRYRPCLLHGATGSGKTEVYLQLTKLALQQKRGAIILVPEIALTPQLLQRLRSRFGNQVAVLHSNLSQGERMDQWRALASGERRIAIGARSAVFAPIKDLGLIVVDEEHDPSYKQDERLPYHGRDLALMRAEQQNCLLLLGSATPDVATYYRAKQGEFRLFEMPQRIAGMHQPAVTLVDMRQQPKQFGRPTLISEQLLTALHETMQKKESAILFLNRRGFTPVLMCGRCGATPKCQNCAVTLTFHRKLQSLICHYCGFQVENYNECQQCRSTSLIDLGMGTEKLEEEIQTMFPESRVARMDRDTTRGHSAHGEIIRDLQNGKTDILVGTQMVTKGLDIDRVTLVGVLSADMSLHLPDFRACERTFQLVTQVAGRAGRGKKPGYVFVQTFSPEHYSIKCACGEDYQGFYTTEIKMRELAQYPPYSQMLALRFTCADQQHLQKVLRSSAIKLALYELAEIMDGQLQGPVEAPIHKLYGKYRSMAIYKYLNTLNYSLRKETHRFLTRLREQLKTQHSVDMKWDVDPINFL